MLGKKKNPLLYIGTVVVGSAIVALIVLGKPAPVAKPIRSAPVPVVEVMMLRPENHQLWIETQGVVKPKTKIELVAQVSGRVERVAAQFASGGSFARDEPLVIVEDADYKIALSQAKATLADARQLLAVEKGKVRQAKREWRDLGNSEANDLFLRKPQLASAEATLLAAQANLAKAELDLTRTQISAPFAGQILSKNVDHGQYLAQGTSVAEVYNSDIAEVRLPLTARQRQGITVGEQGSSVAVIAQYGSNRYQWQAKLARLEGALDAESRQYYAVATIARPFDDVVSNEEGAQRLLKPALSVDQFVQARIAGDYVANSFRVPRSSLRQPQRLWVVDSNNRLKFVPVDVIQSDNQWAIVKPSEPYTVEHSDATDASGKPTADGARGQFISAEPLALVISELSIALDGMQVNISGQFSASTPAAQ